MAVSDTDLNNLAWTMLGEAYPGDKAGMLAVGNTVLNREASGKYGSSITSIVKAPDQYATWGIGSHAQNQGNNPQGRFPIGSAAFQQAKVLATALVNGQVPDNTGGAVDYRAASEGTRWAGGANTITIGGNTFALPKGASASSVQAYAPSPIATPPNNPGLSAIDNAMGTYGQLTYGNGTRTQPDGPYEVSDQQAAADNAAALASMGNIGNPPPQDSSSAAPSNVFAQPGSISSVGGVGAGTSAQGGTSLVPSPGMFDPVGAGPGAFNALAPSNGSNGGTQYVSPSGTITSPQQAGTVAMPQGARPANIDQMFATMPGANSDDTGTSPSWSDLQSQLIQGNYLSPSTTYTRAQMETANPAYLSYIAAQKADPIGQGPGSFSALNALANGASSGGTAPPPQTISTSRTVATPSAAVSSLQTALQNAGFNPGGVDGLFGANTTAAVKAFQQANGLQVDGIVGPETSAALNGLKTNALAAPTAAAPPAGFGSQGYTPISNGNNGVVGNSSNWFSNATGGNDFGGGGGGGGNSHGRKNE